MDEAAQVAHTDRPSPGSVRISATQLFQGHRYVVIVHSGQEYRLQITKAGKLILTK
jgi:hemin uptake protein HemP